jgi:hypothetical protein
LLSTDVVIIQQLNYVQLPRCTLEAHIYLTEQDLILAGTNVTIFF